MTVSHVQRVLDLRYDALLRYAYGLVMSTATDAPTLATACVLVRRAAAWPVRATGEDEIYGVLRRRVLRRALRSRRRPWSAWSALSRKARVEPEPVADRELLRDAGPECRAILLLHLIDDMPTDDAEKLVASLAPRRRDVGAAAAEARRLLNDTTPSTVDDGRVAARLRGPSIRRARVRLLGIGVATLAVATAAGVLVVPSPPPGLGVDVQAGSEMGSSCELDWPARGEALSRGTPLEAPLVRRAVESWQEETEDFTVEPGTELTSREAIRPFVLPVSVLFAGRTNEDQQAVLLCQERKLARYIEPTRADPHLYPHLSTTTLPRLSTTSDHLIERIPFVDLGAAWLVDPDATRVRATPAGVPSPQWTDLPVDRRGVTEDVTTAPEQGDTCDAGLAFGAPRVVRVDLPRSPRYLKPRFSGDKSPTSVSAVHAGEQLDDHADPWTLLPSMAWDTGASAADLGALIGFACGEQFAIDGSDEQAYTEIDELRAVASVPLPGQGPQIAFQASVREHHSDSNESREPDYQGGLTGTDFAYELGDLGDPQADGVAGWTEGLDGYWYYVAAGGADTARIQITGSLSGTTAGRALVLRGPKVGKDEYRPDLPGPELPVAVAFYDKRGTIIKAG